MKAKLSLEPHSVLDGENVVEVWWKGEFIGQVTGAGGPGVRFFSKYPIQDKQLHQEGLINATEVMVCLEGLPHETLRTEQ